MARIAKGTPEMNLPDMTATTAREREILRMFALEMSYGEIAEARATPIP